VKIAFCYKYCTLGGCETVLSTRMHELRSLGIESHVFFFKGGDGERLFEDLGDRFHICPRPADLQAELAAIGPDFLLSLDTPQIGNLLDRRMPDTRYVYEVHTPYPEGLKRLRHQNWRGVSAIFTPTDAHRRLVSSLLSGKIECPVEVVPNPLPHNTAAHRLASANPRPIVIWVGRLDSHKNWQMFVEICRNLSSGGYDLEYWLVGANKIAPLEKLRLWEEVKRANLANRFRWLPFVQYEKIGRLLSFVASSGGCLVYTSHLESFGMAAAEAMASSCPVVVPDLGGFQDFVTAGETGYRYPPGNVQAAVDCVLKSIGDLSGRDKLVAAAYQRVQDKYSARIAVLKLVDTLQNLEKREPQTA
jgi:glycosyltransferase involved in cell wall biosynthesis